MRLFVSDESCRHKECADQDACMDRRAPRRTRALVATGARAARALGSPPGPAAASATGGALRGQIDGFGKLMTATLCASPALRMESGAAEQAGTIVVEVACGVNTATCEVAADLTLRKLGEVRSRRRRRTEAISQE